MYNIREVMFTGCHTHVYVSKCCEVIINPELTCLNHKQNELLFPNLFLKPYPLLTLVPLGISHTQPFPARLGPKHGRGVIPINLAIILTLSSVCSNPSLLISNIASLSNLPTDFHTGTPIQNRCCSPCRRAKVYKKFFKRYK